MHVGLDLSVVRHGLTNGSAVYTYNLVRALLELPGAPSVTTFFCARNSPASREILSELDSRGAEVVEGPNPWHWSPDGAWWLPGGPPMRELLRSVDVFHIGEFHLPPPTETPCVATVHDLTHLTHPQHHLRLNRALHRRRLNWIGKRADRIIAISNSTRSDLLRMTNLVADRIDVVYEARGHDTSSGGLGEAHIDSVLSRYGLASTPYLLSLGTIEPRKNQEALVQAFEGIFRQFQDLVLVLAGAKGWRAGKIREAIDRSPARDRIRFLGPVPSEELPALYAGATVFAFPSLYEGFGLPVLEAMAAGTPVLTSCTSSLPEVAGDAALLVNPESPTDIREGLVRLFESESLRQDFAERGYRQERRFSWRRTAELTMKVYERALSGSSGIPAADPGDHS